MSYHIFHHWYGKKGWTLVGNQHLCNGSCRWDKQQFLQRKYNRNWSILASSHSKAMLTKQIPKTITRNFFFLREAIKKKKRPTWLIRTVLAVTVVIIYSVKGNGAGAIQASERFAFFIELTFCESRKEMQVRGRQELICFNLGKKTCIRCTQKSVVTVLGLSKLSLNSFHQTFGCYSQN